MRLATLVILLLSATIVYAYAYFNDKKVEEVAANGCFDDLNESVWYSSGVLIVKITTYCCGTEIEVKKDGKEYVLVEKVVGDLCRCFCSKEIKIFNVPQDYKIKIIKEKPFEFCGTSTYGKCKNDSDCVRDGCNGEVCRSKFENPVFTICIWKDCYRFEKAACKCVDGKCQWVQYF
ncbi:MAG: eight-cysteine-cluster domain-containing protein [Archaeoglobaceae archaeon]|nr:eight-cysteine-cluster domain-containing protein [Archaeoglobaceae archaeon]MCX8152434.1 eight-cysteine-cluster domain-containing protein [Archaeoglobaceae archaeon]MDW8013774.1 eight-cysteine-cluster domain-containing protein [Archaeoglobaceae archaeon]